MSKVFQYRENIGIIVENGIPRFKKEQNYKKENQDSFLIRTLFTLAGTMPDYTLLNSFGSMDIIPGHYGYSSVGIVEETGSNCSIAEPGTRVLLSACFSKYTSRISNLKAAKNDAIVVAALPESIDGSDATFIPILCAALYLFNELQQADNPDKVMLIGCGILGAILLKLLAAEGIEPVIVVEGQDLKQDLLLENGAKTVVMNRQNIHENLINDVQNGIVLSAGCWAEGVREDIVKRHPNSTVVRGTFNMNDEINRCNWMSRDIYNEAVRILNEGRINIRDLVYQHVHAECISDVCQSIIKKVHGGRTLIYDW